MIVLCEFLRDDAFTGGIETATLPADLRSRIEAGVAANPDAEQEYFNAADFDALFKSWNTHGSPKLPYMVSGHIITGE